MTREIELTQGKVALVDDADFEWLNQWKWYAFPGSRDIFYAARNVSRNESLDRKHHTVRLHRQILGITDPRIFVDHVNHDGLDNRRENLRLATNVQNQANQRKRLAASTSKYKGVYWRSDSRKWRVQISAGEGRKYLGCFVSEDDAARAYNRAAIELSGEHAELNIIPEGDEK